MFESNLWPLLHVIPQLTLIPFLSKQSDLVKPQNGKKINK